MLTGRVRWPGESDRREAAARERIDELRGCVEELASGLAEQEGVLSRPETTPATMAEILSGPEPVAEPNADAMGEPEPERRQTGALASAVDKDLFGVGSPVRVRLVPPWSAELASTVLPRSYQDIVEVLTDSVHPMRAHHLCAALGLSTDKSKVEGFRSKLKRLVERGWITGGARAVRPAGYPAGTWEAAERRAPARR
ncbi:hypothetical protein [Streptomyces alanosinicus]|uniref:Uncharacterized protein n=1 Tax=Streptomyces alanosinicus TaxID=68171 RepID=A0A918YTW4_9ACTN|nr:hypothetical protein [Streptomyces alanosinicus]GHE15954.1 hypothetical protein GCM10010339_92280 [Streptomyces alanosinicus]